MLIPKENLNIVLATFESDSNKTSLQHKQLDHSNEQKNYRMIHEKGYEKLILLS